MAVDAPRSTRIHWGSAAALDQRVPALPSTAAEAGVPPFSVEEAVTGLPWDSSSGAAEAGEVTKVSADAVSAATASVVTRRRHRRMVGITTPLSKGVAGRVQRALSQRNVRRPPVSVKESSRFRSSRNTDPESAL